MADLKTKIAELIETYEAEQEEINEWMAEDFNPMDASGGNFDDAYYMGTEHGEVGGALSVLYELSDVDVWTTVEQKMDDLLLSLTDDEREVLAEKLDGKGSA